MVTDTAKLGWLCFGALVWASTSDAALLRVVPDCPAPGAIIRLQVEQDPRPPVFLPADPLVTSNGNRFRVVLDASSFEDPTSTRSEKVITLGALAEGKYGADVVYRYVTLSGYSEEHAAGTIEFDVARSTSSVPCAPGIMEVHTGGVQDAAAGAQFSEALAVRITDGQRRPTPGVAVVFSRLTRPDDYGTDPASWAGAALVAATAVTDANGLASVPAAANQNVGTYTYVAKLAEGTKPLFAYFTLSNRKGAATSSVRPVVEFYNLARDHYFLTANSAEWSGLDLGISPGWARTGASFLAYPSAVNAPTGIVPVCRFYGRPQSGIDSHFFSASAQECQEVQTKFGEDWALETADAFGAKMPNTVSGECETAHAPLYRTYNNRADANHRYATSRNVIDRMTVQNWIPEGYGPQQVAMCVPQ